jgi:heme-degrading monooxygenase HmoA
MSIIMIAEQPALDEKSYTALAEQMKPLLKSAPGFISHSGGPSPHGGIRITEVWESKQAFENFFNEKFKPTLPPGVTPDMSVQDLCVMFSK